MVLLMLVFVSESQSENRPTAEGDYPQPSGSHQTCLTDIQRAEIHQRLTGQIIKLQSLGKLAPSPAGALPLSLGYPLKAAPGFNDYGFHTISEYVHQTNYSGLTDYACGDRTYSKHKGTDFSLYPFTWELMDSNVAQVIAAEAGTIIDKQDGNYDRMCVNISTSKWNAVYLRHADGSQTWYGHLKKYSLTSKGIGDTVSKGEFLGIVGSSGNSSGPHLHFEVYGAQTNLIDPYSGACNAMNASSWWASQQTYYVSQLLKVSTHSAAPDTSNCDYDIPNLKNDFRPGDDITFAAHFRDFLVGHTTQWSVIRSDGSTFASWVYTNTYYVAGRTRWSSFTLGNNEPYGTNWQLRVGYLGSTSVHYFSVSPQGVPVPDALDAPAMPWTLGGAVNWFGQTNTTHDGVDAAQSGDISDNQTNWVETTLTGPGVLSYWWKVSSEAGYDFMRFYFNGYEQLGKISGNSNWNSQAWTIPSGVHTTRWAYTKDESESALSDCGWLDQVIFSPSLPDLAPYQPAGWSGALVVSTAPGTTLDAVQISATNALYIDWSVANIGGADITTPFKIGVYVDGHMRFTTDVASLQASYYKYTTDAVMPALSIGLHTLQLVADTGGNVAEANEMNNSLTRTIEVHSASSPGSIEFTSSLYNVLESGGAVTVRVARSGGSSGAASVSFTTIVATATAGQDFITTNGTLAWADGDAANKMIVYPVLNDASYEGIEHFSVVLKGTAGAATGTIFAATVTITDDDPAPIVPVVHYVVKNNPNAQSPYTNWYTAAATIQAAIDVAVSNDIIMVTNGVYDTGAWPTNTGAIKNRILANKHVTIRSVNGPSVTVIKGAPGIDGMWGDGAIRCAYLNDGASLIGFTLTNGFQTTGGGVWSPGYLGGFISNCVLTGNGAYWGGGGYHVQIDNSLLIGNRGVLGGGAAYGVLRNCTLKGNSAVNPAIPDDGSGGGAFWCDLYNCTLINNVAGGDGGGAKGESGSSPSIISNCLFQGNTARAGGGASIGRFERCVFIENSASTNFMGYGGGVSGASLYGCTLVSNRAVDGGAAYNANLDRCQVEYNRALGGAGVEDCIISNSVIRFNSAEYVGGAAYDSVLYNCLVVGNTSSDRAGAGEHCRVFNCTVSGNQAATNAGAFSSGTITNSIVYFNVAPISPNTLNSGIGYSCIPGFSGNGNITNDPRFVNSDVMNYRLLSNSPCINKGTNQAWMTGAQDLDRHARIHGSIVDMGAYEYDAAALPPAALPNLVPYRPAGWPEIIVASKVAGTSVDSPTFTSVDPIYIDWAFKNIGVGTLSTTSLISLAVDGMHLQTWFITSMVPNAVAALTDFALAPLPEGMHSVELVVDSGQHVEESIEADNSYVRIIHVTAAVETDLDGDSIDDGWELDHFGSLTNVNMTSDWDRDGFPDHSEYHAGTHPNDTNSFLGLTALMRHAGGSGTIVIWKSVTGKYYNLERYTNLTGSIMYTSVIKHVTGQAVHTIVTDQVDHANGPRFYRVGVE